MSNYTVKALGGNLLPFMTNPATIALVGAGAVAWTIYNLIADDDDKEKDTSNGTKTVPNRSKRLREPLPRQNSTVQPTVRRPLETVNATVGETVETTAREPLPVAVVETLLPEPEQGSGPSPEGEQKEMIRKAMSELGKRSAAARRSKKQI